MQPMQEETKRPSGDSVTRFTAKKRGVDLRHQVVLLAPSDPEYAAAATRIAAALERAGCRQVRIIAASAQESELGSATPIALGHHANNDLIRTLYYTARDVTDRAWPGPGGWAIRSVAHATADGADALLLSVSDSDDIAPAASAFGQLLDRHGLHLPWLHQVEPGRWGQLYLDRVEELLPTPDASLDVVGGGSGDWDYMLAIGRVGVLAVKTGDEKLILRFATEILRFLRVRFSQRTLEDPIQIHGFLRNLLRPFAMLEHHPALSDSLRLEVLQALLDVYRSTEGAANPGLLNDSQHWRVRQNHGTRTALDVYDGGLYFWRQHGLDEGRQWMQLAARFFEPQMASSKPVCDSWGHQWVASLYNTAEYALLAGRLDYFASPSFIDAADRALMAHTNLETGPLFYLLLAAAVTGKDEYLALCSREDAPLPRICPVDDGSVEDAGTTTEEDLVRRVLGQVGSDEFGRAWITGSAGQYPERLTGVSVAPVARLFYDSIESYESFAPAGVYRRDVPFESTFDKISYRAGWGEQDTYLLLDGISGGSHSYQDANCIVRFTNHGKSWLGGPQYGTWTTGTVREQNGVSICCDGEGAGCEARYAHLDQAGTVAGVGLTRTSMDVPGVARWYRQIVVHPRGWILVCDEIVASKEGEFSLQAQWNLLGDVDELVGEAQVRSVRSVQDAVCLTLRQAGGDSGWLTPIHTSGQRVSTRWNLRRSQQLATGESILVATLLNVSATAEEEAPTLNMRDRMLSVEVPGYPAVVVQLNDDIDTAKVAERSIHLVAAGRRPTAGSGSHRSEDGLLDPAWCRSLDSPVSAIETGGDFCLVGTRAGELLRLGPEGDVEDRVRGGEEVSAIAAMEDGGMLIGCVDGTLRRFDPHGGQLWSHTVKWQPMNWDNWTRGHCAVLGLAVGDFDGQRRIIAGCADRHLYGFGMEGEPLWRSPCQWGPAAHVAIAAIGGEGKNQILVGMAQPAIHAWCRVYAADGHYVRALQRPDIVSWSIPSWMTGLEVADVDGDGRPEVIVGMDTNHRQLVVYRADGEILWDADVGSTVTCVVPDHGRIYVGTEGGWIHSFDTCGHRLWSRNVHRPVRGLAPLAPERTLVALDNGSICAIDRAASSGAEAAISSTKSTAYWPGRGLLVGADSANHIALFR
jgi:hypothetical protein